MKKLLLLTFTIITILSQNLIAQRGEYILNFSGIDIGTDESVIIDEVEIINVTRNCDTLLIGPNPVFVMEVLDGIDSYENGLELGKVYPNPNNGISFVELFSYEPQQLEFLVTNQTGQIVMRNSFDVGVGKQLFEIQIADAGFFNLKVIFDKGSLNSQIFSTGKNGFGKYKIRHVSSSGSIPKNQKNFSGFVFEPGDEFIIIGRCFSYPDEVLTLSPEGNDNITFGMRPVPITGIIIEDTLGAFPFTTAFNDNSERNPTYWEWNFGDGYNSSNKDSYHTYNESGYYTVTLIAGNEFGTDTLTLTNVIYVKDVELFCDTTSGYSPLLVNFNAVCNVPDIVSWIWEFGDGETSNEQNPTHIYTNPGSYNLAKVRAVTNSQVYSDSTVIRVFNDPAEVNFTADIVNGWTPQVVNFTSYTTITNPNYYQWSFGDGHTSNESNPSHSYEYPGVYTVVLSVYNNFGYKTETKEDYITIRYCPTNVVDSEGNIYSARGIGTKCWMTENLNIGIRIKGELGAQSDNGIIEKFCYDDSEDNCSNYGGLYQWDELAQYTDGNHGLCPDGWHIMTFDDWDDLIESQGGKELAGKRIKSTSGWVNYNNGNNQSGFNAFPAGRFWGNGNYELYGEAAIFWSYKNDIISDGKHVDYMDYVGGISAGEIIGFSARCVKDITVTVK